MHATLLALSIAALGQLGASSASPAATAPPVLPPPAASPAAPAPTDKPIAISSPGLNGDCRLERVSITADHDIELPAEVEGTLTKLPIKEGMRVEAGQLLGSIDERQAVAAMEVAELQHIAALEKASDMVEEKFATESAAYAKLDLGKDLKANTDSKGAVPEINIEQKRLAYKKADLQIEKAQKDRLIAKKEADAKGAEFKAAKIAVERRQIRAPFAGEVQQVMQREGQWVNPGDRVLRLVQFDTLRADGLVNAADFDPADLAGRKATLTVHLARGRTATATGRVTFVSQILIGVGHSYQIRAEFPNQRVGEFWLIRPGLDADMTIHLNEPPVDAPAPNATAQR